MLTHEAMMIIAKSRGYTGRDVAVLRDDADGAGARIDRTAWTQLGVGDIPTQAEIDAAAADAESARIVAEKNLAIESTNGKTISVIDALVSVLIEKKVIDEKDLPSEAVATLTERQALRDSIEIAKATP
jgi:hypothetical protein